MSSLSPRTSAQRVGLWLGLGLFALLMWLPEPSGFEPAAWPVVAVAFMEQAYGVRPSFAE